MSASDASVLLSVGDGIAEIRFNRPARLNAIDVEMAQALRAAVMAATADPLVRVIVLSGAGRAFVAGGDLGYFRDADEQAPEAARVLIEPMHDALEQLAAAPQPVIAS